MKDAMQIRAQTGSSSTLAGLHYNNVGELSVYSYQRNEPAINIIGGMPTQLTARSMRGATTS
jgi:hypothetical protein